MMEQDELALDVLEAVNATGEIGYAPRALYADRPRAEWSSRSSASDKTLIRCFVGSDASCARR